MIKLTSVEQLIEQALKKPGQHLVTAWAVDENTIDAASTAVDMNLVEATLVGDEKIILDICRKRKIDAGKFTIVHETNDLGAARRSVELINNQKGSLLMKGSLSTDRYMKAILNKERGLMEPGTLLSHVSVISIPVYPKLLIIGDVAIVPQPDLKQKVAITRYLIKTAHSLGIGQPKVAILAATEQVMPGMPACTDAAIISKMSERNQIRGALIDGPLSMDLAINAEAVRIKGIKSAVAGDADCLLFPNIESGNIFYKTNTQYGNGSQAAILTGARVPAVLSSRSDSMQTKLNSIALAVMNAV